MVSYEVVFAQEGMVFGVNSGVRVQVSNCDVRCMPQFLPLTDLGGVVYPIRVVLEVFESNCSSMPQLGCSQPVSRGWGSGRSYAEVVSRDNGII